MILLAAVVMMQGQARFEDSIRSFSLTRFPADGFVIDYTKNRIDFRGKGDELTVSQRSLGLQITSREMVGYAVPSPKNPKEYIPNSIDAKGGVILVIDSKVQDGWLLDAGKPQPPRPFDTSRTVMRTEHAIYRRTEAGIEVRFPGPVTIQEIRTGKALEQVQGGKEKPPIQFVQTTDFAAKSGQIGLRLLMPQADYQMESANFVGRITLNIDRKETVVETAEVRLASLRMEADSAAMTRGAEKGLAVLKGKVVLRGRGPADLDLDADRVELDLDAGGQVTQLRSSGSPVTTVVTVSQAAIAADDAANPKKGDPKKPTKKGGSR